MAVPTHRRFPTKRPSTRLTCGRQTCQARSADPLIAVALLQLAALGCVIQSIGMVQGDRGIQRVALVFFGLFLATVGVLLLRAGSAAPAIGDALVAAGLASCTPLIPQLPAPLVALVLGFGALAEGAFRTLVAGRGLGGFASARAARSSRRLSKPAVL